MANTKKQKQLVVAKESFAVTPKDGVPRVITPDTPLWDNDPIVKKHRDLFESLEAQVSRRGPVVHTATSVPGMSREADLPASKELTPEVKELLVQTLDHDE